MENSACIAPGFWQWKSGVNRNHVQYLPGGGELPDAFTWVEETAPTDGESGQGSHVDSTQPLADFLENGPSQSPPVDIIEAILTHVQAQPPVWLEPYRLEHPVVGLDSTEKKEIVERCADAAARTGWSFLGELVWGGLVEGATHLLDV